VIRPPHAAHVRHRDVFMPAPLSSGQKERPPEGSGYWLRRRDRQSSAHLCAIAKRSGARLVIVNADPTPYDSIADAMLAGRIGEIVPMLLSR
jgi:hypothetical protein